MDDVIGDDSEVEKTPNAETIEAIEELENGGGIKYNNSKDFYEDLEI